MPAQSADGGTVRYSGRLGGSGIDDSWSGPDTITHVFSSGAAVIDDPMSFPWGSAEETHWRRPVLFDLSRCSDGDLTALVQVLTVATPHDRLVVADPDVRSRLSDALALPEGSFLADVPEDPHSVLGPLAARKLNDSLLREVLAPIITDELDSVAGLRELARRPLDVVDIAAANGWRATFVPEPHLYAKVADAWLVERESANVVIVPADQLRDETLQPTLDALRPGGLLVVLHSAGDVSATGGITVRDSLALLDSSLGRNRIIEHVWGLHTSPGGKVRGAVLGVRPLGRRATPEPELA